MSALSEFVAKQKHYNDQMKKAMDGLKGDLQSQSDLIKKLQENQGQLSDEDKANLDELNAASESMSKSLDELDQLNAPQLPEGTDNEENANNEGNENNEENKEEGNENAPADENLLEKPEGVEDDRVVTKRSDKMEKVRPNDFPIK